METLTIITKYAEKILNKLEQTDSNILKNTWDISECKIICNYEEDEKTNVLEMISLIIYDFINFEILNIFAKKYLKSRKDLTFKQKEDIFFMFIKSNYLTNDEGFSFISYHVLYVPLYDFLKTSNIINLDGWLKFRTNQYNIILKDIMLQTIYDYEANTNYVDFMDFLKTFTETQCSLVDKVHLHCEKDGQIFLLDDNLEDITKYYIELYSDEITIADSTMEDIIVYILLKLCPTEIIIHANEKYTNKNFIFTLKEIFSNSVTLCKSCPLCTK